MRWRLGIVAVFCLLAGAVAVAAASTRGVLRFHERFTQLPYTGVNTSGRYTLFATSVQGQVGVVLDELTGIRTTVWLPSDCPEPNPNYGMLDGGWLLEDCTSSRVDLYSLAGGTWRDVQIAPGCVNFSAGPGSSCTPYSIGSDWIAYDEESTRFGDRDVFQNITTGVLRRDPANARTLADLSSPTLVHHVCSPLRAPHQGAMVGLPGGLVLALNGGGNVLERCGSHLHRALPNLDQGFVGDTWSTSDTPALVWEAPPWRALTGIFLPSLQRFSMNAPTPRLRFAGVPFQTSDGHVYFDAPLRSPFGRVEVVWAPLPKPHS